MRSSNMRSVGNSSRAEVDSNLLWSSVSSVDKRSTSALAIWVSPRTAWASPMMWRGAGQLVDQHGPGHRRTKAQLGLRHNRRNPAKSATCRGLPRDHLVGSAPIEPKCRGCQRTGLVHFEASRQAANTPAACRAACRHAAWSDTGAPSASRLSAPSGHRPLPIGRIPSDRFAALERPTCGSIQQPRPGVPRETPRAGVGWAASDP